MIECVKHLCLNGVKVREREERLVAGVLQRGDGERVEIEKSGVRWVDFGEDEVLEGDGDGCLGTQPAI